MNEPHSTLIKAMAEKILANDPFSQWLGISVIDAAEGYSKVQMTVRSEMLNGLGIVHGGICFSLADTCFGYASNTRNNVSVALDTSINFLKPVQIDDVLTAEAKEMHNGRSTGLFHITITNQRHHVVAVFKGTCFKTGRQLSDNVI